MRDTIAAIGMAVAGLLALAAQTKAHADDICAKVADRIRAGDEDVDVTSGNGLIRLDEGDKDVGAILSKWHAAPALVDAAKSASEIASPSIAWLGNSGAGAITWTVGTAHCPVVMFFDTRDGQAREMAPPASWSTDEGYLCPNGVAGIGTVDSVPALIEEVDYDANAKADLRFVPWHGDHWGAACRISASFTTPLSVVGTFCRKDVDCKVMQNEALDLAHRVEIGAQENEESPYQRELASKTPDINELPTFGHSPDMIYTRFEGAKLVPFPAAGAGAIAVIGGGSFGWRDFPGYLVAIWREAGGVLEPLAGFQLFKQRGEVVSVTIDPH